MQSAPSICFFKKMLLSYSYFFIIINCAVVAVSAQGTMTDCYDWLHNGGARTSGVYRVSPPGISPFDVYCDMDTSGGGWTVFQKRMDLSLSFYTKTWTDYKNGFDNGLTRNFWLGNDKIHALSSKDLRVQLRIDLMGDRDPNPNATMYRNGYFFAEYANFTVDNEANKYTLHLSPCVSGNASYPNNNIDMIWNSERPFSTFDVDNDGGDCSNPDENSMQMGGWWANWRARCGYGSLNGKYEPSITFNSFFGMSWLINTGPVEGRKYIQPVQSQMKMRKIP